nr:MAG TPA: hypothetical protein [Caudoviricetes sp.]
MSILPSQRIFHLGLSSEGSSVVSDTQTKELPL